VSITIQNRDKCVVLLFRLEALLHGNRASIGQSVQGVNSTLTRHLIPVDAGTLGAPSVPTKPACAERRAGVFNEIAPNRTADIQSPVMVYRQGSTASPGTPAGVQPSFLMAATAYCSCKGARRRRFGSALFSEEVIGNCCSRRSESLET
jgi:hypothetical protein